MTIIIALIVILCAIALPYILNRTPLPAQALLPTKPLIVFCMRAYVPTMTAGAEITSHITNKYLQKAGWDVVVIVKNWSVPEYEGIPIIPSNSTDAVTYDDNPIAATYLAAAKYIGFQNIKFEDGLEVARKYNKPAVYFIHSTSAGKEFFNYTGGYPIYVVYNSWSMMSDIYAPYKSYIVKPWVDIDRFRKIRGSNGTKVTLINLNESKGGTFLVQLAKAMPDVKFIGVNGGYGNQIIDKSVKNIEYYDKTDKIESVYKETKVLLVPSLLETWGRVAVEAMSAGIPVIINDVPGLRECCDGAAIICRRDDINSWIQQIRRLLNIPSYYELWSDKAIARSNTLEDDSDIKGLGNWLMMAQPSLSQ